MLTVWLYFNDGEMFGEEYILWVCADYAEQNTRKYGSLNIPSSRALRDITEKHAAVTQASARLVK
jgi:phosphomannomutase